MPAVRKCCQLVALVLAVAVSLSPPADAQTQTLRLTGVQVRGSERLPADEVAALAGLTIGEPVTLEDLQAAANRLAGLGLFDHVTYKYEATPQTLSVTFFVQEMAQLIPCRFDNFVWLREEELLERLQQEIPLFTGVAPPGGYLVEEIKRALEQILAERGIRASIRHVAPMGEEGGWNLFEVMGVSIPVASVDLRGAEKLGAKKRRQATDRLLAKDYSHSFLAGFIQHTLLPLYHEHGYLDARFGEPEVEYLGEAEGSHPVRIVFPVEEGEAFHVREIHWSGNQVLSADQLEKNLNLDAGEVADTVQLEADLEKIRREAYGSRGYIRARLDFTPELDRQALTADLFINVQEGDLYRFQELKLSHLTGQAADWLRRRWKLKPGDPYDDVYARKFLRDDVGELMGRLSPRPARVNFRLDTDDQQKTVTVLISFR